MRPNVFTRTRWHAAAAPCFAILELVLELLGPSGCRHGVASGEPLPAGTQPQPPTGPESATPQAAPAPTLRSLGAGFPERGPWISFYGAAGEMGDLTRVAERFRIINIDADPDTDGGAANFSDEQIRQLRAGGRNRVISYFDIGSCERHRTYWDKVPPPFVSCRANRRAQLGPYQGYPDERWMNPGDPEYRKLLLDYVAPRLAARGIDGFYLDNLEVLEHGPDAAEAPCDAACREGGLDLVRALRERYPDRLIVMQNATSDVTRTATTGGVAFATLLDGVAHEEVYAPTYDATAEQQLLAWSEMGITSRDGRPLFIGVEDYVGSCRNVGQARAAFARAREHGFSPCVSDESAGQRVVCYWDF